MKLDENRDLESREVVFADVVAADDRRQRLSVVTVGGGAGKVGVEELVLVLSEGGATLRSWPVNAVRVLADLPDSMICVEAGTETLTWRCGEEASRRELARAAGGGAGALSEAALGALLDDSGAGEADADAERWVQRLAERLARLDALNVAGMLAAATEGGGARLADRLEAGAAAGAALEARLQRYSATAGAGAGGARGPAARSEAARADAAARELLAYLRRLYDWLDAPPLRDLDSLSEVSLASSEGRARALEAAEALRAALRGAEGAEAGLAGAHRLGAVRERLRRLGRARDALAAALARHLNNALIHLANDAHTAAPGPAPAPAAHHAPLLLYAPFMHWLKDMDEKAYDGLVKVYVGTWSRVYERALGGACEAARARPDGALDEVLTLVEALCNAEQDFCAQFFHLDADVKQNEGSDGERSEGGEGGERGEGGGARRGAGAETKRFMGELFPTLETSLVALVGHMERSEPYGAMRALACVGRRVLGAEEAEGGAGRWARAALAAAAVAAKRGADRAVAERLAALPEAVRAAGRRPRCGVLACVHELEEMAAECEVIFAGGRRADLDRWYLSLATAIMRTIQRADHPRTPRAVLHMENYHRLHAAVSALRAPALDVLRRECRARYADALRAYVTQYFGRPLDKLAQFFEGVAEAVAAGVREDEVCYRAAFSKHELRRLLAMYPAHEVRKSLHRLYRTVEKHLSEEGGLLQVVWRAMQEEFIAQHVALQARIAACYPGAGLALPLTTHDILDAFSDIAREH